MAGLLSGPSEQDLMDPATFQLLQRWQPSPFSPEMNRYLDYLATQQGRLSTQTQPAQIPGALADLSALSPQGGLLAPSFGQTGGSFSNQLTGPTSANIEDRRNPITADQVAAWLRPNVGDLLAPDLDPLRFWRR